MSRRPHSPTPETSAQVEALSGYGIQQEEIAVYLGIDAKTLRKYYREQLDKGTVKANVAVARALHKQATEGGSVAAAIFWMKARAGWREKHEVELTGPDGGPVATTSLTAEMDPKAATELYRRLVTGRA